ncbi:hypothetical protein B0H14DRAFT_44270 [Mycena olivaceomarginata]|nr:hypothetical protein B0H14DRAFT_44270 [Mycena olivaceomarginata]
MHRYFSQNKGKRHVSVLRGLGGAGKTQTALKFVDESALSERFSSVFFVDASTVGTVDLSFRKIATAKRAGSTTQDALRWMVAQQTEWLILFNNADDRSIDLRQFFPRCTHGNILITTRNRQLCVHAPDSQHMLSDMEEADAVALLLRSSVNEATPENQGEARRVVQVKDGLFIHRPGSHGCFKALHCFPLAVVQAGAFISKTGTLGRYLDLYMENKAHLLRERPNQTHDDYAWTVYTTWQISVDRLSPIAARLLQVSSFLHHGGIAEKIFSNAVLYDSMIFGELGPTAEDLQDAREFLTQFVTSARTWNQLVFLESTADLQSYSLVEMDSLGESYSIHPLVHSWTRDNITDVRVRECALAILGMCMPVGEHLDDHQFRRRLLPHVDSILSQTREMKPYLLQRYGAICLEGGRAAAGAQLFGKLTVDAKRLLGEEHPNTLFAMVNLATSYRDLGQSKEAAELREAVLEKSKRLLGEEDPNTLLAMANLAISYRDLGQSKEAAELGEAVLEKSKQLLGEEHPNTLLAMANLAISYGNLGQSKEAAELREGVLEKSKRLLGEEHPDTLLAMANLAISYGDLGQSKEAAELGEGVLEKSKRLLGEEHPNTLRVMGDLAVSYRDLGQSKEAAELCEAVLEKSKRLLGEEHPDTLRAMGDLAISYGDLGQSKEAAELREAVLEKSKRLLGEEHPNTLVAMANLAISYGDLGQSKEAAELGEGVLEKSKRLLGEEHPNTLRAMTNLAISYGDLGQSKEAAELREAVLEKSKRLLGEEHPDTLLAMANLAISYGDLGQSKEAAELGEGVLEKSKRLLGEEHPNTLRVMGDLAVSYRDLGQSKEAAELREAVLEKSKRLLGEEHPDTLRAMGDLAISYGDLGQSKEAAELREAVLEKSKRLLGEEHPNTLVAMANLAISYGNLGQSKEAAELREAVLEKSKRLLGELSSVQPLFIPEDSELNFASDSASEGLEATGDFITLTPEEWEVGADQWADLDDDGWYEQLQLSRKRSGTLSSNISDHEDRKRLKSSDVQSHGTGSTAESSSAAGPSHTVASGSTSVAIIAAWGPSKTTKPIVPDRPRRGSGVPEAAYDPWK